MGRYIGYKFGLRVDYFTLLLSLLIGLIIIAKFGSMISKNESLFDKNMKSSKNT